MRKMKRASLLKLGSCLVTMLFILFVQGCGQNELILNSDTRYPTTYKKQDATTLIQMRREFATANPFLTSSITDFGFCGFLDNLLPAPWPARIPDLTRSEAINATQSFIAQNSSFLGVKPSEKVTFSRVDSFTVSDGSVKWHLSSNLQKQDTLEVYDTHLNFSLTNGKITSCEGNWYPAIYVPAKINVNKDRVKSILLNKVVYLSDIAGRPIPMTITAKSLETAAFSNMIYPLKTTAKIELHVVWVVSIPDVFYVVYLDVMSGEIIGGFPTVYS
ncbi:MAG: hypothetical protein Q8904_02395 [Bacteroidota bacterium]|nr:hypothetical protein [Bacteroidota bacterium]